jgi:hypothetical protein
MKWPLQISPRPNINFPYVSYQLERGTFCTVLRSFDLVVLFSAVADYMPVRSRRGVQHFSSPYFIEAHTDQKQAVNSFNHFNSMLHGHYSS